MAVTEWPRAIVFFMLEYLGSMVVQFCSEVLRHLLGQLGQSKEWLDFFLGCAFRFANGSLAR